MDELKLLVEMVANLPSMALWVIALFFGYKVVVVGSIYGVIRFVVGKVHDVMLAKKTAPPPEITYKEIRPMLDAMCIKSETDTLIAQIHRLRGKGVSIESQYIHEQSVNWLREAIDLKEAADRELGRKKA